MVQLPQVVNNAQDSSLMGGAHPLSSHHVAAPTLSTQLTSTHMDILDPLLQSHNSPTSLDVFQAYSPEGQALW